MSLIFDIKFDVYWMKVWFGKVKFSYLPKWKFKLPNQTLI